ncbi:MAG: glycosyl hydrolase family 8 [Pseudomonadota bacterium]
MRWLIALITGCWLVACGEQQPPVLSAADWQAYKTAFVRAEGRVADTGNRGISHSEGQGYGMLLALAAGDRPTFNSLWNWTRKTLQRDDKLFAWRWDESTVPHITDWNNATDGDLLIAWALALAGERWNERGLREEARVIAARLRESVIHHAGIGPLLLPAQHGFKHQDSLTLNPSYWVFPAFTVLDRVDPDPLWKGLTQSGLRLLDMARFGAHGTPPDWVIFHPDGRLEPPADVEKRRFGFEVVRVPLYLCLAGLQTPELTQAFKSAWPSDEAPGWTDLVNGEQAAYALPLGQRAIRGMLDACTPSAPPPPKLDIDSKDYYGSTLMLLTRIALTRSKALL